MKIAQITDSKTSKLLFEVKHWDERSSSQNTIFTLGKRFLFTNCMGQFVTVIASLIITEVHNKHIIVCFPFPRSNSPRAV